MQLGDTVQVVVVNRGSRARKTRRRYIKARVVYANDRFVVVDTGLYRTTFYRGEAFIVRERENRIV